ncbi:Myosin-1 [Camellia lanceoleosa]|uniref:Myosin-1 n=1 Tax=Camellia lanceoleosa TaxID=1840588 RepID=A0ACC0IQ08_9ERIC|nr:Myosin-1 [Camellia lanceoleosa]
MLKSSEIRQPSSNPEKLNLKSANEYKYLRQSNCYSISGVDDALQFRIVMEVLDIVHVSKEDQQSVFKMLTAVLWLGNVSFTVIDNENHVEPVADEGGLLALNFPSFRYLCSLESQESLDNVPVELYKRSGRIEEQISMLQH